MAGLTEKQKKLVALVVENSGIDGQTMTQGQMLEKAGYKPGSIVNPKAILGSKKVQRAIADTAAEMDSIRSNLLDELKLRDFSEEKAAEIVKMIDTLTKNHQLLSGGVTARTQSAVLLHELSDEELQEMTKLKQPDEDISS